MSGSIWRRRGRQALRAPIDSDAALVLQRDVAGALTRLVAPNAARPGGFTMRGKADKHLRLLGRTLVVRADAPTVAAVVGDALAAAGSRLQPRPELGPGEAGVWTADSMFGSVPRFVVRDSPSVPGVTEVGTVRFAMSLRFPQGGVFTDRAIDTVTAALAAARLPLAEFRREFAPDPVENPGGLDGPWVAIALVPLPA